MAEYSYTQRTLSALRDQGFVPGMVERHLARVGPAGIKQDLFGILDILAYRRDVPGAKLLGVQSTGPNGYSEHVRTFVFNTHVDGLLATGHIDIQLWCWHKRGEQWEPRITHITPEFLALERQKNRKPPSKDAGIPVYVKP